MARDIEEQLVFAVSPTGQGDGIPVLLLGMPTLAWEFIKDGKSHHFDLSAIGVPLKAVLFGGKDHTTIVREIERIAAGQGNILSDERNKDYGVKPLEEILLEALKAQHDALDFLLARLVSLEKTFRPTKSPAWSAVLEGNKAIKLLEARAAEGEQRDRNPSTNEAPEG